MVVGYICDWVVVFVVVGKEKETREREREREDYFILLSSLYYFIELYVKIKTEI